MEILTIFDAHYEAIAESWCCYIYLITGTYRRSNDVFLAVYIRPISIFQQAYHWSTIEIRVFT